jgi:hypothetical protein
MSSIASGLSFSASDTGTESASGKTNALVWFKEFLQERHANIVTIKKILPLIQYDIWVNTKIQKIRFTTY